MLFFQGNNARALRDRSRLALVALFLSVTIAASAADEEAR